MSLVERARRWWRGYITVETAAAGVPIAGQRKVCDHVIILDGTMSTLEQGQESNAGLLFHLLTDSGARHRPNVYYEPGQQWEGWRNGIHLIEGRGINPQILRAYGWLANHYRPGDRIYLFGYSRGAYAVRALAGMIDRVGLLRRSEATQSAVNLAFRHYSKGGDSPAADDFRRLYCHATVRVRMIGVWDTVKALGLRVPILWRFVSKMHDFRDHHLGESVDSGFQALSLHETRVAFRPELWDTKANSAAKIEQAWFAGVHGDIGGDIGCSPDSRHLSNIPMVWMMERAVQMGLSPPDDWPSRFPCNVDAPMVCTWRGFGLWFLTRARRVPLRDASEYIHPSVALRRKSYWWEF